VSSLVRDQLVAALVAVALSLPFLVAGLALILPVMGVGVGSWLEQDSGPLAEVVYFFSVPLHFDRGFTRGVIDTRPVVLYVSATLFGLFLTVRSLEARRWQ